MPTSTFQPSFAAGVLSPALHGRVDVARYDIGLKVGRNVIIHPHGGVSNRPGTEFVGTLADESRPATLIPFLRGETNYVLEFQDDMRVIFDGGYVMAGGSPYSTTTPFTAADARSLDYAQSVDLMVFAHPLYFPHTLAHNGPTSWAFGHMDVDPVIQLAQNLTGVPNDAGTLSYEYAVTSVSGGAESVGYSRVTVSDAQDLNIADTFNRLRWDNPGGVDEFNVYRKRNGTWGYIGYTPTDAFDDDNIQRDTTLTIPMPADVFEGPGQYPSRVAFFQQRLFLAGATDEPETIVGSRTGDLFNFTRSRSLRADDRVRFDVTGGSLNRIVGLLPLSELLVFTTSAEFSVIGPDGAIPADNVIQRQFGYSGSSGVKPMVIEDTAIFVDRTGRTVRDLRYSFEQDGYTGNDLTIFAQHFFDGREIAGWAYAKNPDSIVWVVLDDGSLLSLTYKREHQVWAWTEQDLGGAVESVAVIPEEDRDGVYFVVRREIAGSTRRFVERLASRAFATSSEAYFVDAGLTYRGAPATQISGLDHLEGATVVALADGSVVQNLTVSGGAITLPVAAEVVHVGLPFTAEIETLPPAIQIEGVGMARGRKHKVNKMRLQVQQTRGIKAADADGRFTEILQTGGDLSAPIPLTTGMIDVTIFGSWNDEGSIRVRQDYPLPMTILGLAPEISIGRD